MRRALAPEMWKEPPSGLCRSRKRERGRRVAGPRDEGFLVTWRPFDEEEGRKNPHGEGWEVLRLAWARRPKMSQQRAGQGRYRHWDALPLLLLGCSIPPLFPCPGLPTWLWRGRGRKMVLF